MMGTIDLAKHRWPTAKLRSVTSQNNSGFYTSLVKLPSVLILGLQNSLPSHYTILARDDNKQIYFKIHEKLAFFLS